MMTATVARPIVGRFSWHDLMATDVEKAIAFYGGLFGWTIRPMEMGAMGTYTQLMHGEDGFGGVVALDAGRGIPSHWIPYLVTDDMAGSIARIPDLGGSVAMGPFEIPTVGEAAIVADPTGAHFTLFQWLNNTPLVAEPTAVSSPGKVIWNELMTQDPDAALPFYQALFGLEHQAMPFDGMEYHLLLRGGESEAGVMQAPPDMTVSAWNVYFESGDIDASVARVVELGGAIMMAPMSVPGIGRMAYATDTNGAVFAMLEPAPRM